MFLVLYIGWIFIKKSNFEILSDNVSILKFSHNFFFQNDHPILVDHLSLSAPPYRLPSLIIGYDSIDISKSCRKSPPIVAYTFRIWSSFMGHSFSSHNRMRLHMQVGPISHTCAFAHELALQVASLPPLGACTFMHELAPSIIPLLSLGYLHLHA